MGPRTVWRPADWTGTDHLEGRRHTDLRYERAGREHIHLQQRYRVFTWIPIVVFILLSGADVHKGIYAIFSRNITTGKTERLVDPFPGGSSRPELSRDGCTLAFVRRVRDKEALVLK